MLHRALFCRSSASPGILLEHHAGHLPFAPPLQAVFATITDDADDYARTRRGATRAGLRVEQDTRNEKINLKVREHSLASAGAARGLTQGSRRRHGLGPTPRQGRPGVLPRRRDRGSGFGSGCT
jgi:hypothetical protein